MEEVSEEFIIKYDISSSRVEIQQGIEGSR